MGAPQNENDDRKIQKYKYGHQNAELKLFGLVPEKLHSRNASAAAFKSEIFPAGSGT